MHEFVAWAGFAGAWFLVAGPIYQAALELRDEDFRRDELIAATSHLERSEPVSPWWWLLPPVHYFKQRRRARADRERMLAALSSDQMRAMLEFMNKATGWLLVAAGATLIGVKESYEVVEINEWPTAVFVVLVVVMAALCVAYTVVRMIRSRAVLARES